MRVIFINRFFHPDHSATSQILSDLAFGLVEAGHEVIVVTSRLRYEGGEPLPEREVINGVQVERIWTSKFGRTSLPGRAFDYLTFYWSARRALGRLVRRGDVVVAKTDPPMVSIIAAGVARAKGAVLVTWMQDIFPEVADALRLGGPGMTMALRPVRWMRDRSLRDVRLHVVIGERMASHLMSLGVAPAQIRIIPNWADCTAIVPVPHEKNALRSEWGLKGAFVVGYSGNLGRAHEIETLLNAIGATEQALVRDPRLPPVRWLFIGGGLSSRNLGSVWRMQSSRP